MKQIGTVSSKTTDCSKVLHLKDPMGICNRNYYKVLLDTPLLSSLDVFDGLRILCVASPRRSLCFGSFYCCLQLFVNVKTEKLILVLFVKVITVLACW